MKQKSDDNVPTETKIEINNENLFNFIEEEHVAKQEYIKMETALPEAQQGSVMFMFPGLEGLHTSLKPLCKQLKSHVWCLQYCCGNPKKTIQDLAESLLPVKKQTNTHHLITKFVSFQFILSKINKNQTFTILAHSFGTMVAMEVATLLESMGYVGRLIFVDGSATFVKKLVGRQLDTEDDFQLEMSILFRALSRIIPNEIFLKYKVLHHFPM